MKISRKNTHIHPITTAPMWIIPTVSYIMCKTDDIIVQNEWVYPTIILVFIIVWLFIHFNIDK
jgi:hypothetical protein